MYLGNTKTVSRRHDLPQIVAEVAPPVVTYREPLVVEAAEQAGTVVAAVTGHTVTAVTGGAKSLGRGLKRGAEWLGKHPLVVTRTVTQEVPVVVEKVVETPVESSSSVFFEDYLPEDLLQETVQATA